MHSLQEGFLGKQMYLGKWCFPFFRIMTLKVEPIWSDLIESSAGPKLDGQN